MTNPNRLVSPLGLRVRPRDTVITLQPVIESSSQVLTDADHPQTEDDADDPQSCSCLDKALSAAASSNTHILHNANHPRQVIVATSKVITDLTIGPLVIVASYCPFCGEKYD